MIYLILTVMGLLDLKLVAQSHRIPSNEPNRFQLVTDARQYPNKFCDKFFVLTVSDRIELESYIEGRCRLSVDRNYLSFRIEEQKTMDNGVIYYRASKENGTNANMPSLIEVWDYRTTDKTFQGALPSYNLMARLHLFQKRVDLFSKTQPVASRRIPTNAGPLVEISGRFREPPVSGPRGSIHYFVQKGTNYLIEVDLFSFQLAREYQPRKDFRIKGYYDGNILIVTQIIYETLY